jgi:hypothetical protein
VGENQIPATAQPGSTDPNGSKEPPSNPVTPENFLKLTAFSAAVIYGALFIGYRTYYNELRIRPEDVGISSTFVLVRSIGFIALAIGVVALVGSIVFVFETAPTRLNNAPRPKTERVNKI